MAEFILLPLFSYQGLVPSVSFHSVISIDWLIESTSLRYTNNS